MKEHLSNFFKKIIFVSLVFGLVISSAIGQEIITLEKSIEIAMKNSPEMKRSQLNLLRSQQLLNAQKASLKSRFSMTLTPYSYTHNKQFDTQTSKYFTNETKLSSGVFSISQPVKWTDGTIELINQLSWRDSRTTADVYNPITSESYEQTSISKSYNNDLYLRLTQPIFTYNRTKLALRELELDLENTSLSYAISKLNIEKQVTQVFYNVYDYKMSLEIKKDEYHNREQSYNIIKNKVEAGLAAREELYQAELDLATSKSNVQNSQVSLDNALDDFKQLIGISLFDDINITSDVTHQPVETSLQKALEIGLEKRMELRQNQINIENAQFDLIRTSASNEFKGNLSVSYGIIGTDKGFDQMYDNPTKNQRASLSLEIPLWDWGEKKMRINAAEAVIQTRELSHENEKNNIIIGIRKVYRNLKNLTNQIEIARQNLRNAQLTYDINLERYKNGDLTSMDLNLYQNQLSEKKMGRIRALINYKIELLNLKIQSLWDFERNRPVIPEN